MTLDRGILAKIDQRIFAEFDHLNRVQLVKVPVSNAAWSTWRRYCEAVRLTMGEGIAGLIAYELGTVLGKDGEDGSVFGAEMERRLVERAEDLDARERRLNERERSLRASEQRLRARTVPLESLTRVKTGRNEPCPCGSGFKYKRCHGI